MVCARLKLELLIIPVLKYGKGRNTVENVIYGLLDAYYIKCVRFIHLLEQRIFQAFTEK